MIYNALGISGDPCSGKTSLIERLAQELRWSIVSIGGLFRKRFERWESENSLYRQGVDFDEWWANTVTDAEIRKVNREAATRLAQGGVILDSRYIAENAKNIPSVARVFLTAPLEVRGTRALDAGRYPGVPLSGANGVMDLLHKRGRNEYEKGQSLFDIDYRDARDYHLTLNTGLLTIEQEVSQVLALIRSPITS